MGLFDGNIPTDLAYKGGGAVVIGAALLQALKMFKEFRRSDSRESFADEVQKRAWERLGEMEKRVDSFAKERNDASEKAIRLESLAKRFEERIGELEVKIEELTIERDDLKKEIAKLRREWSPSP